MKVVLVSGVTGQDGANMVEYLLKNTDHKIYGMVRRSAKPNYENIEEFLKNERFKIVFGDLTDYFSIEKLVIDLKPDYLINFAANSFVGISWQMPKQVFETNTLGVLYCLEAIRKNKPDCRFYSAGCHDTKTRVITPKGIQEYTDLNKGDLVYSLNEDTSEIELKPIKRIIEKDHDGEMIHFKGLGKDQLVTSDHKILTQTKKGKLLYKKAKKAREMAVFKFPKGKWKGQKYSKKIDLKQFTECQTNDNIRYIHSEDLFYLIGLYIGDGSCDKGTKKALARPKEAISRNSKGQFFFEPEVEEEERTYNCFRNFLFIPKEDKNSKKIEGVLKRNKIRYSRSGRNGIAIYFQSEALNSIFDKCGHHSKNKTIPKWVLDASSEMIEKVVEGIMDSDGDKKGNISTISNLLVRDLIEASIKIKKHISFRTREPRKAILKDGRIIKGNHPENTINILNRDVWYRKSLKTKWVEKDTKAKKVKYKGKVWCLEIEGNHNFLIERNGKVCFSGNSSEEFGDVDYSPQDIKHPIKPRSPYGASKAASRHLVKVYRESYNLYAIHSILFNHEGVKRGHEFVTRKITKGVARIKHSVDNNKIVVPIELGNLDARRDWSDSRDFIKGVWLMMNREEPKDYILSSGETHTVREFVEKAFGFAGLKGRWETGEKPEDEVFILELDGGLEVIGVKVDPEFYRPAEVELLLGDSTPAREELGWKPEISFDKLVEDMVKFDIENYVEK